MFVGCPGPSRRAGAPTDTTTAVARDMPCPGIRRTTPRSCAARSRRLVEKAQLELRYEAFVRIGQVESEDLGDPAEPVAEGVRVHVDPGRRLRHVAEGVEVGPQR